MTPNVSAQIANTHTIFNITTTLLLLPFGTQLAKMATKILPDRAEEKEDTMHLEYIQPMIPIETRGETKIGISAIAVNAIRNELTRMTKMAKEKRRAQLRCRPRRQHRPAGGGAQPRGIHRLL